MATNEQETARSNNVRQQGSIGGWLFSGYADMEQDNKKRPCSRGGNREAMANKSKHSSTLGGVFGTPDHANGPSSPDGDEDGAATPIANNQQVNTSISNLRARQELPPAGVMSPRNKNNNQAFSLSGEGQDVPASEAWSGGRVKNEARDYARRNWGTDVISHSPRQREMPVDPVHDESRPYSEMSDASTALPIYPEPQEPHTPVEQVNDTPEVVAEPEPTTETTPAQTPVNESPVAAAPSNNNEDLKIDILKISDDKPASIANSGRRVIKHRGGTDSMAGILGGGGGDVVDYGASRGITSTQPYDSSSLNSERSRNALANRGTAGSVIYGGGYA